MPVLSGENQGFLIGRNAKLVCLGDSITQASDGYVRVLANLITAAYPERNIQVINAGIGGNRAPDMLARLDSDVIAHAPNWVTINVGINDVWHGFTDFVTNQPRPDGDGPNGIPLDVYEATVAQMVDHLRETTDAQIVLLPPTVIGEDVDNPDNRQNAKLQGYVEAMQRVADSRSTYLAPTHEDFVGALRAGVSSNPEFRLTTDGVHLNPVGNHVMALSILYSLGFGTT